MSLFGAHNTISNGLTSAARDIVLAGGNLVQIFSKNPRKHDRHINRSEEEIKEFREYMESNSSHVVVHSSYLLNLAREWTPQSYWIISLINEIRFCHKIGAFGIVVHMGKSLELSTNIAYNNMFTAIMHILTHTKKQKDVQFILETPAGQGTELGHKLEDFAHFYRKFPKDLRKDRIKLCIDTAHIFSAGYDITSKDKVKMYLEAFEELIGLRYVALIHLNDSRFELGRRVDRHDNIGKGKIGLEPLVYISTFFQKHTVPIVLETPGEGYRTEIKRLRM